MKTLREIEQLLRSEGLAFVLVRASHHYVYNVTFANGKQRMITFSKTPSDYRALMNNRMWLRRMKREAESTQA